jgi:hypothetical protein
LNSEFVGPVEELSILKALNANHLLTKGFWTRIQQIEQANELYERFVETLPALALMPKQVAPFNVKKKIVSQETEEQTVRRVWSGKGILAQGGKIPLSECLPVLHRYFYELARRCSARGPLPTTSFLHVQKPLAERVRPRFENIARELITVIRTVFDTVLYGALKNGTWRTKYPVLGR